MSEEDNENPMTEEEQQNYGALVTGYAASPGFILGYNTVLRSPLAQTVEAADRQFRQTEQVPLTSLDLYEYFIALEPQQIEQLAKALFVEGYITFTNNVEELYDPEIVFAGMLDVMNELSTRATQLGVSPQQILKVTEDPDEYIPMMDRKFKQTDLELFEEKIVEAEKGLVQLPDMTALEAMWKAQSVATLGFDVSNTDPSQFRNFVAGMRTSALEAQERGETYNATAQMTHALETQNPGATAFMQHENIQDRFMTWAAEQRP